MEKEGRAGSGGASMDVDDEEEVEVPSCTSYAFRLH
jgi:hypothetical protein